MQANRPRELGRMGEKKKEEEITGKRTMERSRRGKEPADFYRWVIILLKLDFYGHRCTHQQPVLVL